MMSNLIKAMQIFESYGPFTMDCQNGKLIVHIHPRIVSIEDAKTLDKLGFYECEFDEYGEGGDCFICYYGSYCAE